MSIHKAAMQSKLQKMMKFERAEDGNARATDHKAESQHHEHKPEQSQEEGDSVSWETGNDGEKEAVEGKKQKGRSTAEVQRKANRQKENDAGKTTNKKPRKRWLRKGAVKQLSREAKSLAKTTLVESGSSMGDEVDDKR